MPQVYLSLGSNIERERHIAAALAELEQRFGPLTVSSVYESAAVGFAGDNFYNLVVGFETTAEVPAIVEALREIEARHGRVRGGERFSARTLDIDLLLYGDRVGEVGGVALPRAEITRYAFVLGPLAEIAGDHVHPSLGQRFAALWEGFDRASQPLWRVPWPP